MKKFLAVDNNLFGMKYKFFDTLEEANEDKDFLFDAIYVQVYPKKVEEKEWNDIKNAL